MDFPVSKLYTFSSKHTERIISSLTLLSSHFRPVDDWEVILALKQPKKKGQISKSSSSESYYFLRFYDSDCVVCTPKDADASEMRENAVVCELSVEDKCTRVNELITRTSWKISGKQFYLGSFIVGIGAVDQIHPGETRLLKIRSSFDKTFFSPLNST